MKPSVRFVQTAFNLGAAGVLLWFAAPLLAFGAWHPFDDMRARAALLALAPLLLFGLRGVQLLLARRRNERLLHSLESNDAGPELSQRFRQAIAMIGHADAREQRGRVSAAGGSAGGKFSSCPGT